MITVSRLNEIIVRVTEKIGRRPLCDDLIFAQAIEDYVRGEIARLVLLDQE